MKFYLILLLLLIVLQACAKEILITEQELFKQKCVENNHMWMKMSEIKNGMIVGKPCYGCMPDNKNHICNENEYEAFIK